MKKIWLWNHYATKMYENAGGRHFWFAQNLKKAGYDTTVFSANLVHRTSQVYPTDQGKYGLYEKEGIPFVFVKTYKSKGNGLDRVVNMLSFYRNLFPVAKSYSKVQGKPDLILASSVHPLTMLAGIQVAKKMDIPCICEVRDLWPEAIFKFGRLKETSLLGRALTAGEKWIYKRAHALIFTKEGDVDYILEKKWDLNQGGPLDLSKVHYINNGVDLEAFDENVEKNKLEDPDLDSDKFKVVYVGALRPLNDVGRILDAAKLLEDEKDISFLIYGEGLDMAMLKERIEGEKIKNVKLKGYINKQYVPYVLSKSSLNLLNYSPRLFNLDRGNSSNKLFEYMASGKPVLANVKMAYSLIERYGCGIELEGDRVEDLAQAILQIREMDQEDYRQMGEGARRGAQDFDFKIHSRKLIDIIESLTGDKSE